LRGATSRPCSRPNRRPNNRPNSRPNSRPAQSCSSSSSFYFYYSSCTVVLLLSLPPLRLLFLHAVAGRGAAAAVSRARCCCMCWRRRVRATSNSEKGKARLGTRHHALHGHPYSGSSRGAGVCDADGGPEGSSRQGVSRARAPDGAPDAIGTLCSSSYLGGGQPNQALLRSDAAHSARRLALSASRPACTVQTHPMPSTNRLRSAHTHSLALSLLLSLTTTTTTITPQAHPLNLPRPPSTTANSKPTFPIY